MLWLLLATIGFNSVDETLQTDFRKKIITSKISKHLIRFSILEYLIYYATQKSIKLILSVLTALLITSCATKRFRDAQNVDEVAFVKKKKPGLPDIVIDNTIDHYEKKQKGQLDQHPAKTSKPPKGTFH